MQLDFHEILTIGVDSGIIFGADLNNQSHFNGEWLSNFCTETKHGIDRQVLVLANEFSINFSRIPPLFTATFWRLFAFH